MADPADDQLLEDGDITDGHFELDLADEDALLADDYDEKPLKSLRSSEIGRRNHQNMEDEDFIEIGVEEDLALADETKNEGENVKSMRKTIVFDDSNNDDSDEGGKERTRFKTERNINSVPRPTAVIPETLDAVAVKAQPFYNNRGGRGGGMIARRGFRGMRGGFQRGGGILPPRFRGPHPLQQQQHQFNHPMIPMQIVQHKQQQQQLQQQQSQPQHLDINQMQQQYHQQYPQVPMEHYSTPAEELYQPPPTPAQQPTYQPPPAIHPPATNIHVNPHFRGPRPQVNQNMNLWNGSSYVQTSQGIHQHYQQSQPQYQTHYQPNHQAAQWAENTNVNEYYPNPSTSAPNNYGGPDDQYYNGVNSGGDYYNQPQQQQPQHHHHHHQQHQQTQQNQPTTNYHQPIGGAVGPPQINWNENNYYGAHQGPPPATPGPSAPHDLYNLNPQLNQNQFTRPPPIHHQQMQLQHKKGFLQNKMIPFRNNIINNNNNNKFQAIRGRGAKVVHKKEIIPNKVSPTKPVRVETGALRKIYITNLHEVPVITNPNNVLPQKNNIPEPEEEDEEMKAYRLKIEEQKKLREQILRQKEEKRKVAAQQKSLMLAARKRIAGEQSAASATTIHTSNTNQQFQVVRVRLKDGRTVIRKLSTAQISKLKKITPPTAAPVVQQKKTEVQPKSRIVVVDNLSASTTQKQLENMAKQMGKVERVKLNSETKRATVIFENSLSAAAFVQKFQRKMVDLSMISLRMLLNSDDISPSTSSISSASTSTMASSLLSAVAASSSSSLAVPSTSVTTSTTTTPIQQTSNGILQQTTSSVEMKSDQKPSLLAKPMMNFGRN